LTVFITNYQKEYWWFEGLEDINFVEKTVSGGSGSFEMDGGFPSSVYVVDQLLDGGGP
jgi:hypothetical protein